MNGYDGLKHVTQWQILCYEIKQKRRLKMPKNLMHLDLRKGPQYQIMMLLSSSSAANKFKEAVIADNEEADVVVVPDARQFSSRRIEGNVKQGAENMIGMYSSGAFRDKKMLA
ncbi:hypothetical protein KUTeg_021657 [Tegillarca granosa]|uniref:Uncharacterized protein n=1 Tax=Tegillarca granosa TaxID=220873 RepID=A0ABQ9E3Y6_TEGGR|nr:hypothetical protein KUTeg_021657 [Tegillarca granosa]